MTWSAPATTSFECSPVLAPPPAPHSSLRHSPPSCLRTSEPQKLSTRVPQRFTMDGSRCVRPHLNDINATLQTIFNEDDSRLHPNAVASLHAVTLPRRNGDSSPPSAAEAFCAAAAAADVVSSDLAQPAAGKLTLRMVRRMAAAVGLGVDVITATATSVLVDHDSRRGLRVVLFRAPKADGCGYSPAVAIRGDRVDDLGHHYSPVRVSLTRTVGDLPSAMAAARNSDEGKQAPHWTHLFLTADVEPVAATPWQEWPDVMFTLNGVWGPSPAAPACDWPVGVPRDGQLAQLASWADYHRTSVRVHYHHRDGGASHFRILPRLCAVAHKGALFGRAVYVEVLDGVGRLGHSPVAPAGRRPYTDVYVDDQKAIGQS